MTRQVKLISMLFMIGIILLLLMTGGYHIYTSLKSKKGLLINQCHTALSKAIIKERDKYIDVKYFYYDAKLSPYPTISLREKQEWMDQEFLTQEDPCRHRLDSLLQAELTRQGIHLWTGIKCNRNGEINASRPEEQFQHAIILDETKFSLGKNHIVLQSFIKIPNRILVNWRQIYALISITLLGIGAFIWLALQKEEKQPATVKKNKPQPQPAPKSIIVPMEKEIIIQWKQLTSCILYEENSHIVKRGTIEKTLHRDKVFYFEAFCKAPNHRLTYEEMLEAVQKKQGYTSDKPVEKTTRIEKDKLRHAIKDLESTLQPLGIQILNERGKGYQMIFPDKTVQKEEESHPA